MTLRNCRHVLPIATLELQSIARKPTATMRQFSRYFKKSLVVDPAFYSHATRRTHGRLFASASSSSYDPLARRPNKVCDPYGQGGKPLSRLESQNLLGTIHTDWKLEPPDDTSTPTELVRDFYHMDMLHGAQFVHTIAAVATVHNHYPCIILERKLLPRAWQVVTRVKCRTLTLEGLSFNDFHVAMVSVKIYESLQIHYNKGYIVALYLKIVFYSFIILYDSKLMSKYRDQKLKDC